jgi:hypothetical protein
MQVLEIDNTTFSPGIPREHGVDSLGKLSTALLIDTTGVNPYITNLVGFGKLACLSNLGKPTLLSGLGRSIYKILEGHLIDIPCVRQDNVYR